MASVARSRACTVGRVDTEATPLAESINAAAAATIATGPSVAARRPNETAAAPRDLRTSRAGQTSARLSPCSLRLSCPPVWCSVRGVHQVRAERSPASNRTPGRPNQAQRSHPPEAIMRASDKFFRRHLIGAWFAALAVPLVCAALAGALSAIPASAAGVSSGRPPVTPLGVLDSCRDQRLPGRSLGRPARMHAGARAAGSGVRSSAPRPSRSARTAGTSMSPPRASNAIAVFRRDASTGKLTQAAGTAGCIAAGGAGGCANAVGLDGPNSVAVSADGSERLRDLRHQRRRRDLPAQSRRPVRSRQARRRERLHRQRRHDRLHDGPRARRAGRRRRQSRRPQRLRRRVQGQRDRRVRPRRLDRRAHAARRHRPAASPPRRRRAAPPASRWALRRAWRSAATATTCTSAAALSNALDVLARNPSTGALTQATNGTGCIVDSRAHRLHDRHAARRRRRGRGQPRRRRRVRDVAAQQQRDHVHAHADDRPARPAVGHLRLRDLRVRRRLLARPRAAAPPRDWRSPPTARACTRRRSARARSTCFNRNGRIGGPDAEAAPPRLRGHDRRPRLRARASAARRELGRRQPRRQVRLRGSVREQRRRRVQAGHQASAPAGHERDAMATSTKESGDDGRPAIGEGDRRPDSDEHGITRGELLKAAAVAHRGCCSAGRAAAAAARTRPAASPPRQPAGSRA